MEGTPDKNTDLVMETPTASFQALINKDVVLHGLLPTEAVVFNDWTKSVTGETANLGVTSCDLDGMSKRITYSDDNYQTHNPDDALIDGVIRVASKTCIQPGTTCILDMINLAHVTTVVKERRLIEFHSLENQLVDTVLVITCLWTARGLNTVLEQWDDWWDRWILHRCPVTNDHESEQ